MKQRTQELLTASSLLARDIRNGIFTPFLGAGASSLRSGEIDFDSYPWRDVALTLTAISRPLHARSRHFLRSFIKHRLNITSKASESAVNKIVPIDSAPPSLIIGGADLSETLLVKLQVELIRATVRLTQYFGLSFSQERRSIHHLEDCSVNFDLKSEEQTKEDAREDDIEEDRERKKTRDLASDCLARLFAVTDIALDLYSKTSGEGESPFLDYRTGVKRCLERKRLYERLLTLTIGLIGENRELYLDRLNRYCVGGHYPIPYEVEKGKSPSYGQLRLDAIQWLSDLLWYTLRYWVPCYPTTAELAFELSLAVNNAPPRRAELAQAAQALENEDENPEINLLAEITGDLVTYCETVQERKEGPGWQTTAFYHAVAAALQYQFDKYQQAALQKGSSLKDLIASRASKFPVPIVFTTNFDSALQKVLEINDICYHVVFPVLEPKEVMPKWKIQTIHRRKLSLPAQDWKIFCCIEGDGGPQITFEGPIIVKLHGSPSLPLTDKTHQHWLVLSEAGYLEALESDAKLPVWLGNQLISQEARVENRPVSRSLWFLGYSISDWNVRLRLYEHCKEHSKLDGRRSTVDWSADVYRTAILGKLNVDQCLGDLNELPMMIYSVLKDGERTEVYSDKVKQLMEVVRVNLPRNQR